MAVYDVDGNGSVAAFSDGLMIWKYRLGQRGDALTNNGTLIGAGAVRTTAKEIEAYIESILWQCDVGGDGEFGICDALMILKSLIGLTGHNLVDGCLTGGDIRNASEIDDYIDRMRA